ncbi:MAG: hypothetical protein H3C48_06985 [Chitinophagaceae bacterium]|nr:hypothetical protein [Chitinophagaceae bacterium]
MNVQKGIFFVLAFIIGSSISIGQTDKQLCFLPDSGNASTCKSNIHSSHFPTSLYFHLAKPACSHLHAPTTPNGRF